jgi:purine-cytosine permease-like protein
MKARTLWSRILVIVGAIAMLLGAIDPLEGSLIILVGSGLVTLGTLLGRSRRRILLYWVWVLILIAVGVGLMWVLSAFGGLGGSTGRSLWWALVLLPYPLGWIMGITSLILRLIEFIKGKRQET